VLMGSSDPKNSFDGTTHWLLHTVTRFFAFPSNGPLNNSGARVVESDIEEGGTWGKHWELGSPVHEPWNGEHDLSVSAGSSSYQTGR